MILDSGLLFWATLYRVAQKVIHYQESSINRIKNRQCGYISHKFWVQNEHKNVISFYKISICDLICDVINFRVWSSDIGEINIYDKIMIEIRQKKKIIFLHKSPSNRWFRNGIHGLLSRADARGSADIIYRMWRISILCR